MEAYNNRLAVLKEKISEFFSSPKRRLIFYFSAVLVLILFLLLALFSGGKQNTVPAVSVKPSVAVPSLYPVEKKIEAEYVPGQIVVKIRSNITKEQFSKHLEQYNAKIIDSIEEFHMYSLEVTRGEEESILQRLIKDEFVEKAERNVVTEIFMTVNDEKYKEQWHLRNSSSKADICAETAWDKSQGDGIKVAVLDTGIDQNHPDLAGKIVGSQVFTGGSIDDGNGHGTHVAGTIAANTNNGKGVAGVCPKCQLLIGKVNGDNGKGDLFAVAKGIKWAADQGAKVINLSLGAPQTIAASQEAVNYAVGKGVIVVAAAGNNNTSQKFYPAAYDNVVSVAATEQGDQKTNFSNFGQWVKIAAPGFNIVSTTPRKPFQLQQLQPGLQLNYSAMSGTSQASPVVAGVAALLYAKGGSKDAVIKKIYDSAEQIAGTGKYWVKGRVSACKSLGAGCPKGTGVKLAFTCISEKGKCITPTVVVQQANESECKASSKNPADKFPDSSDGNKPPAVKPPPDNGGGGKDPCGGGWTSSSFWKTIIQCLN